ncbi:F-box domain containing protein [Parasponia andersonii]|uniref:F-box domain containing protein n=1 Tax=Parasponia andersonii TaxID=3476 RepID=A0A2P5D5K9_PARAD|nr:F-box domain containing protein [Parasponia andersonii]
MKRKRLVSRCQCLHHQIHDDDDDDIDNIVTTSGGVGRRWEELDSNLLTLIFIRIPPHQITTSQLQCVCKSWLSVLTDPFFSTMIIIHVLANIDYNMQGQHY